MLRVPQDVLVRQARGGVHQGVVAEVDDRIRAELPIRRMLELSK